MAELYGKATGCSHGKGGSMHLFDAKLNFLGGHAIVGGQIPLATGVAFASKYKETDQVTVCFFGEAAVNQGAFHESLNMAQLWKLPCIYICENNKYGMGTSLERAMSLQNISEKACAYELESEYVDGMDVLAMRHATQRAVKRAREQSAPTLIEAPAPTNRIARRSRIARASSSNSDPACADAFLSFMPAGSGRNDLSVEADAAGRRFRSKASAMAGTAAGELPQSRAEAAAH